MAGYYILSVKFPKQRRMLSFSVRGLHTLVIADTKRARGCFYTFRKPLYPSSPRASGNLQSAALLGLRALPMVRVYSY